MILPETQKLYEQQEELTELQAYANMLNTPDVDGKIGEVTDLTAVMRIKYNAGSSTRIHTSDAFNKYFAEFVKANAPELITRTVQKALEMIKEQKALAAQEVLDQLNITGATAPTTAPEGAPVFTGAMQAVGYAGEPIQQYVNAASLPVSVITFSSDELPDGLTLDADTGLLEGTVAEAGTYGITIKATNDKGTSTKVLSLVIAERTMPNIPAPTAPMIYGQLNVAVTQNKPFTFQCAAMNVPASGSTWTITPPLPATVPGLALDPVTGLITGTPTATPGPYQFTLRVDTPTGGWDEAQFTMTVNPDVPNIGTNPSLNPLPARTKTEGDSFYHQCAGLNITPGAYWTMVGAPASLSIDQNGLISGTLVAGDAAGSPYTIQVTVTLVDGRVDTKSMSLTVNAGTPATPVITAGQTFNAQENVAFTAQITCDQVGATFAIASGSLPTSLTMDGNGNITGTPAVGDATNSPYQIQVTATKDNQTSVPETVTINIAV